MLSTNSLYILDIVEDTIVDGPGFRTSIYASGCIHECPGCHNEESWDIHNGTLMTLDDIVEVIKRNPFANVTFTGGDPFCQTREFTSLAKEIKQKYDKTIWCYTGFRFEKIVKNKELSELLPWIDVLVDGRFIEARRELNLKFRGSSNQRIINVPQSLLENKIVLWESRT